MADDEFGVEQVNSNMLGGSSSISDIGGELIDDGGPLTTKGLYGSRPDRSSQA